MRRQPRAGRRRRSTRRSRQRFVRAGSPGAPEPLAAGAELHVDPEADDPPELLEGSSIDLGTLALEYFVLAIDPYPRAPGAELLAEAADPPESESDSPFAALAALQRKPTAGN